ncbi:MAG: hypothetical protein WCA16_08860 [Candidatus Sulfotelmatobacter sp.]
MTRSNFSSVSKIASTRNSLAWGKRNLFKKPLEKTTGALFFAAILIVCSVAVGCSSDKPKPATSTSPTPVVQNTTAMMPASTPTSPVQAAEKPAKKIVHRRPATLTYADKTTGVSFQYPRKYDLKTGDDAGKLVSSIPLPMNFVQPGGVALAAVELPGTVYNSNDLAAAFFDVSVNKSLTAEQCGQFLEPQPAPSTPADSSTPDSSAQAAAQPSKLILGDLDLQGTEAVSGEGIRQSDAKYFHLFQNGACYEFAVNVTTAASDSQLAMKHVDREKAFQQLEKILATVKVETVAAPEVATTVPSTPAPTPETPAQ